MEVCELDADCVSIRGCVGPTVDRAGLATFASCRGPTVLTVVVPGVVSVELRVVVGGLSCSSSVSIALNAANRLLVGDGCMFLEDCFFFFFFFFNRD